MKLKDCRIGDKVKIIDGLAEGCCTGYIPGNIGIVRSKEEYEKLFERAHKSRIGWVPEYHKNEFVGYIESENAIYTLNNCNVELIERSKTTKKICVEEKDMKDMKDCKIVDINIIVPDKVVEVFFSDSLKEKMVCHKDDTFNLRNCLFIAIAKHLYKSEYTFEGIEYKANELKYLKKYVKIVDSALKNYYKKEEEKKKQVEAEERAKAVELNKKAKIAKHKARRKEKQRNERIGEMIEAYVNAMMIIDDIHCTCPDCDDCECKLEHDCNGDGTCECKDDVFVDDLK